MKNLTLKRIGCLSLGIIASGFALATNSDSLRIQPMSAVEEMPAQRVEPLSDRQIRMSPDKPPVALVHFEFGEDKKREAPAVTLDLQGTLRAKFEYQPEISQARYQVRNARFALRGELYSRLTYRMEVDFVDEGVMKMLDAYVGLKLYRGLTFTIGQMRVPFSIDAHRGPHMQYFANRSFLAKQAGNVRDVGAMFGWKFGRDIPMHFQVGMFNGSGLTRQKDYWTNDFNYAAKAQFGFMPGMNFVVSYQTTLPEAVRIHHYDVGCTYRTGNWLFEAEYLRKEYAKGAFDGVNSFDGFVCYDLPLNRFFRKVSFLGRYDYLSDHSRGIADETTGLLMIDDYERHRVTAGLTFSLGLPFTADIRLNYEKYFYDPLATPGISDRDKVVLEFMAHF